MPKKQEKPRHNLYTAVAEAMISAPHVDTGDNNLYTAMGWKPRKSKKKEDKRDGSK